VAKISKIHQQNNDDDDTVIVEAHVVIICCGLDYFVIAAQALSQRSYKTTNVRNDCL
jgi:hypothetical protein